MSVGVCVCCMSVCAFLCVHVNVCVQVNVCVHVCPSQAANMRAGRTCFKLIACYVCNRIHTLTNY